MKYAYGLRKLKEERWGRGADCPGPCHREAAVLFLTDMPGADTGVGESVQGEDTYWNDPCMVCLSI